jgi:hypothetical protein
MATRFCRDSDSADLGNERIGSLGMYLLLALIA